MPVVQISKRPRLFRDGKGGWDDSFGSDKQLAKLSTSFTAQGLVYSTMICLMGCYGRHEIEESARFRLDCIFNKYLLFSESVMIIPCESSPHTHY